MGIEELLPYAVVLVVAVGAVLIILYATRLRKGEKQVLEPSSGMVPAERWRHRAQRSVSPDSAKDAHEELRTLSLEREILSDAIRHLYEAHAEGRITEAEREQLAKRYKSRMLTIKEAITENESLVALHELEAMQDDLIQLFDERFDELNTKIEALRSQVGIETKETIVPTAIPIPTQMEAETEKKEEEPAKKTRRRTSRKPQKSRKTAAEERIEKIRSEVEKVLDRLEQMEVET